MFCGLLIRSKDFFFLSDEEEVVDFIELAVPLLEATLQRSPGE